jgi:predicted alpha/beta hydrolase
MSRIQEREFPTNSNYKVPIQFIKTAGATQTIVILPALGMAARLYIPLAQELAKQEIDVVLFEQGGHGNSSIRASRNVNYGIKEW